MAITPGHPVSHQRGFTLLIAIIFMSVLLSLGLALGSIGYKQVILASGATQSAYAFYAADAALECALRVDELQSGDDPNDNPFSYANHFPHPNNDLACGAVTKNRCYQKSGCTNANQDIFTGASRTTYWRIPIDSANPQSPSSGDERRCADLTVIKQAVEQAGDTYIFAQGYDVPCSVVNNPGLLRLSARGLQAHY